MNDFYDSVMGRIQYLEGLYKSKKEQYEKINKEVKRLSSEEDILHKVEKVLKQLIDKMAQKDLSNMDRLVTYGLKSVFVDRDITFESSIEERGKKVWVNMKTMYDGKEVDSQCRGSVSVIESFILRVLCILKTKKAPFLLLDEPFGAVNVEYIEHVSNLVAELAEKLNMDILLVTHNPGFSESSHNTFRAKSTNNNLRIEKIK